MAYRVGPQKIVPSPGTYSAHVECGGKFSQVWPKLHLLSMWRWKRAPIARLVSLSVIWGGPPVFQVASSQTWGRARPRGKRLPRAALLPRCDRCLTGASALDFGHPHVEWKAEHALWAPKVTKSFLAHLEHYAAARVHSATLRENRPLNASTWGVAPRLSKTWSEKASGGAVAHQRASSAPAVARECSLSPPLWPSPRSQPRCPRVVREDERVRISAPCHVWRRFPRSRLHSLRFHQ